LFFYVDIDIGNCDHDMYLPVLFSFAVFNLVKVHGVVVVDGRPEETAQVTGIMLVF